MSHRTGGQTQKIVLSFSFTLILIFEIKTYFCLQATKDIVRKNFTRELEFFDFCKQRLHKQYLALNLDAAKP